MKAVIAIDSFKGSMTSVEAGNAAADGILRVFTDAGITIVPIADGGEGTVEALTEGTNGTIHSVRVHDPIGRIIDAKYGITETGTAVIEMAAASGLTLLTESERNPMYTTTYGVGELIKDAIYKGCRNFIIGIGGSATNEGGIGMLQALGYDMLDGNGKQTSYGAAGLRELRQIKVDNALTELKECTFRIASDVSNPLIGTNGCSAVFAPQKGAGQDDIESMDRWMAAYARLVKEVNPASDAATPGAGAAGGIGFAFLSFLHGILKPGIDIVMKETGLEEYIKDADIVLTGEGKLDSQTVMGKAPIGVARLAKKYNKPVIAFAGVVDADASICNSYGIDAYFPIVRGISTASAAMNTETAKQNMTEAVEQAMRLIKAMGRKQYEF